MVRAALRVLGFELKGLAAIGLWVLRRRHGVPSGATAVTYSKEQTFTLSLMLFGMAVETVVVDVLLVAVGVPAWVRFPVLALDVYGLLFGIMMATGCVTRPHVITSDEVRIRYGVYFDARVPRDRIAAVRTHRNDNESSMVSVKDGHLRVAVASRTNVTIELTEPVTVLRPLGSPAEVTTISFFADSPETAATALRSGATSRA
jgi:membrane protein YdbS with pleckstrin-like domain